MTWAGGISKEKNKNRRKPKARFLFFSLEMPPALWAKDPQLPLSPPRRPDAAIVVFFSEKTRFFSNPTS